MTDQEKFDFFYLAIKDQKKLKHKNIPKTENTMLHKYLWEMYLVFRVAKDTKRLKDFFADIATDFHLNTHVFNELHEEYKYV